MGLGAGRLWPRFGTGETCLVGDSEGCVGFGGPQAFRANSGCPHTDQMLGTQRVLGPQVLYPQVPKPASSQPGRRKAGGGMPRDR